MECSHNEEDGLFYADMYSKVANLPKRVEAVYKFIFKQMAINPRSIGFGNLLFRTIGLGSGYTSTSGINTTKMIDVASSLLCVQKGDYTERPNLGNHLQSRQLGAPPSRQTLTEYWLDGTIETLANL